MRSNNTPLDISGNVFIFVWVQIREGFNKVQASTSLDMQRDEHYMPMRTTHYHVEGFVIRYLIFLLSGYISYWNAEKNKNLPHHLLTDIEICFSDHCTCQRRRHPSVASFSNHMSFISLLPLCLNSMASDTEKV